MKNFAIGILLFSIVLAVRKTANTIDYVSDSETYSVDTIPESSESVDTIPESSESVEFVDSIEQIVLNTVADMKNIFGTKYDDLINSSALANGLDPSLLYRLLYEESHFRDDIITGKKRSRSGALGIAQFMPTTAVQELGSVEAALNPDIAIPGAARYLAKLIRSTGSVDVGVAAYNWGVGNIKRKGLSKAPTETINYVKNITGTDIAA